MARKPEPRPRDVEQVLRELAKADRVRGLLDAGKPGLGKGLLSLPIDANTGTGVAPTPSAIAPNLSGRPGILDEIDSRFDRAPGVELPQSGGGLLGLSPKPPRGLLAPVTDTGQKPLDGMLGGPPPSMPQAQSRPGTERRPLAARAGNFLDDILFGGAAGDLRAGRRARDEEQAAAAAHREAFAFAQTPQGFDPNRYGARLAELGQAPDMSGIVNLEGVNDGRDVRGLRQRQEERGVTAGALAPTTRLPEEQRPDALAGVADYLRGQGYGFDPNTSPAGVSAAVGAGMGADSWLDNERGDRNLAEQQRAAQSAESFRASDLGFRQDESQWERQFREGRAQADDSYRAQELDYRREALTVPNSTGDVIAPILSKVATMGVEGLTEGERLIWERYQQSGQNPFAALLGGNPAGAPAAPAASQPQAADPFPGIAEGQSVTQDGVTYRRQGNQMVPVG